MTKSESKFRVWANKSYPNSYIEKMPDFKQNGMAGLKGLPDYLMITNGKTHWYEVKVSRRADLRLHCSDFTPAQLVKFPQMIKAGASIYMYVFSKRLHKFRICPFEFELKNLVEESPFVSLRASKAISPHLENHEL